MTTRHAASQPHTTPGGRFAPSTLSAVALVALVALVAWLLVAVLSGPDSAGRHVSDGVSRVLHPSSSTTGGLTAADGYIGDAGVGVQDDDLPAVSKLDPALLAAVREAARQARTQGVRFRVTSGWRSRAYQQHLLDEAVAKYGSYAEARRWVKTPEGSTHVTGHAIDIGPGDAARWLARHGSDVGLCQVYANEIWHYELLTRPHGTCPAMQADSSGT